MKDKRILRCVFFTAILLLVIPQFLYAQDVQRMTREELKAVIDNPDVIILDVRSGRDWKSSESKIKNAVREEPYQTDSWADKYDRNKTYVLYCA